MCQIDFRRKQRLDIYFGQNNYKNITQKKITYKSVLDEDNIIIRTKNVCLTKCDENTMEWVLLIDEKTGISLRDWQIKDIKAYPTDRQPFNSCLVKLNRKYFYPKTLIEKHTGVNVGARTFDEFLNAALIQEKEKLQVEV